MNPKIKILFKSRVFNQNREIHTLKMHYPRRYIKYPVFWPNLGRIWTLKHDLKIIFKKIKNNLKIFDLKIIFIIN